jgi:hypothetical protein
MKRGLRVVKWNTHWTMETYSRWRIFVLMYVCMYVCMYACMYVWMHACMYVYMYVCIYVCMYVGLRVCICIKHIPIECDGFKNALIMNSIKCKKKLGRIISKISLINKFLIFLKLWFLSDIPGMQYRHLHRDPNISTTLSNAGDVRSGRRWRRWWEVVLAGLYQSTHLMNRMTVWQPCLPDATFWVLLTSFGQTCLLNSLRPAPFLWRHWNTKFMQTDVEHLERWKSTKVMKP